MKRLLVIGIILLVAIFIVPSIYRFVVFRGVKDALVFIDGHLQKVKRGDYEAAYQDFSELLKDKMDYGRFREFYTYMKNRFGQIRTWKVYQSTKLIDFGSNVSGLSEIYDVEFERLTVKMLFVVQKVKAGYRLADFKYNVVLSNLHEIKKVFGR